MTGREPSHPAVPRRPLRETGKRVLVSQSVHAALAQFVAELSTDDHEYTFSEVISLLIHHYHVTATPRANLEGEAGNAATDT